MKTTILFILFTIFSFIGFSQDVIVKRDGEKIDAKVIEITKTTIKYKKFEQEDGPIRNISISEVAEIIYNNGDWEKFKEEDYTEEVEEETTTRPTRRRPRPTISKKDPFFDNGMYLDLMLGGGNANETQSYFSYYDDFGNYYPNGYDYTSEYMSSFAAISFRIGHKWYFGNGEKYRPGLQVQWMKVGIHINPEGGYASYGLSPLHVGLTNIFKINDKHGIEANITGGFTVLNFNPFSTIIGNGSPNSDVGYSFGGELKYRFNILAIGVDFSRINTGFNHSDERHDLNVISLTAGIKL